MKPRRSALPLPRYVERKPLKSGWGYFFNVPTWVRRAGCPCTNEPLGTDYEAAVSRAEKVLLPAFDSWRSGGASDVTPKVAAVGTLDWLFAEYRADRRFTKLDPKTKRIHESGMRIVGNHVLKNGRRLGDVRLEAIDTSVADRLYDRLLFVAETDTAGNTIERERCTNIGERRRQSRLNSVRACGWWQFRMHPWGTMGKGRERQITSRPTSARPLSKWAWGENFKRNQVAGTRTKPFRRRCS
jgi:hypothetical protein